MSIDPKTAMATADDVAKLVGVSRWTVNRAFKPNASISPKSRAKVMAAAEELGYAPDLLAASLASDRSNLVALLIDDFANPHKLQIIEQLTRILRGHGWDTLLVNTLNAADAPSALLTASQRRVDAAVLIGVQFNDQELESALGARRVRKLILFARQSENPNTISICCDDQAAMTTLTDYVGEQGYTRPLFVAGPQTTSAHLLRKETFVSRWQQVHAQQLPFVAVPAYDPQLSYQAVADHLRTDGERPDILVCENDALAMGAMDALRFEFNLRTPDDIAVIGFDDVPQAATPQYQLTTYRQPIAEMVNALVDVLKGTADMETLNQFSGQLVVRASA
ncbi:LacI family transcriptional regulator [Epibacterium ulvae]|uniref:LacI family DNA-binding transcriptional regulator n=1 Tax=Epibacterium ulvae TaxID=1156985 RepID=UPI001BFC6673|nr:LacI family DNA-binding transcriptional regulator [Epibacterium ulvae]MBT8155610.1 LacI family transcriptional regulator [Epibacterium ulvae]